MEYPLNPVAGQQYSIGGRSWQYDTSVAPGLWKLIPVSTADVDAAAASALSAAAIRDAMAGDTGTTQIKGTWFGGTKALLSTLATGAGAALLGMIQSYGGAIERAVAEKFRETVTFEDFGAVGDGTYHPLSERFATLALAQAQYPFVTALSQTRDWAAIQAAVNTGHNVRATSNRRRYYLREKVSLSLSTLFAQYYQTQTVDLRGSQYVLATADNVPFLEITGWPYAQGTHFVILGGGARVTRTVVNTVDGNIPSDGVRIIEGYGHKVDNIDFRGFTKGAAVHLYVSDPAKWCESVVLTNIRGLDNYRGILTDVVGGDTTASFDQTHIHNCEFNCTIANARAFELNGFHGRTTIDNCGGWLGENSALGTQGIYLNGNFSNAVMKGAWFDGASTKDNSIVTGPAYTNNSETNSSAGGALTIVGAGVTTDVANYLKLPDGWQWKFKVLDHSTVYGAHVYVDGIGATGETRTASPGAIVVKTGTFRMARGAANTMYVTTPFATPVGMRRLLDVQLTPFANGNDNRARAAGPCGIHTEVVENGSVTGVTFFSCSTNAYGAGGTEDLYFRYRLECQMN